MRTVLRNSRLLTEHIRPVMAWNYRRYVLSSMPVPRPAAAELVYTTHKIEGNFSNFSAWHQRTKVYATLWETGERERSKIKDEGSCSAQTLSVPLPPMFSMTRNRIRACPQRVVYRSRGPERLALSPLAGRRRSVTPLTERHGHTGFRCLIHDLCSTLIDQGKTHQCLSGRWASYKNYSTSRVTANVRSRRAPTPPLRPRT